MFLSNCYIEKFLEFYLNLDYSDNFHKGQEFNILRNIFIKSMNKIQANTKLSFIIILLRAIGSDRDPIYFLPISLSLDY